MQQQSTPGSAVLSAPGASLALFFKRVRNTTYNLCRHLSPEDTLAQPAEFVSPPKWHLGHTTWFFEKFVLETYARNYKLFNPDFHFVFNSYYEQAGERLQRDKRGLLFRPYFKEVLAYREYVDTAMLGLIEASADEEALRNLIILGLSHEQQHQELLITDLKYTFSLHPWGPAVSTPELSQELKAPTAQSAQSTVKLAEGLYEIGFDGDGFCYDNELGRHKVYLPSTEIFSRLITNAEYLQFMEAGAYSNPLLWHSDGWAWVQQTEATMPMHWRMTDHGYEEFTLLGWRSLKLDASVTHGNFYEAWAFAEWSGYSLPTEFQWEAASPHFDWGQRWEWTQSAYLPYPGFKKAPGAVGEYNGKFMINQMVLRGASVATATGHSRNTYRNFFHPQFQWQYSGIRLCKNLA